MTLKELQNTLVEFEKEYWVAPKGENEQTRHITLHLTKLIGKIGAICEKKEHGFEADKNILETEVIPDLLYFALSLSQVHGVDLEKAFLARLEANKKKVTGWKS